jgi:hypothetical protein
MATAFWAMTPAPKMLWQFGELGYSYSINTCENGSISNDCRLSPKPARWDYLNNPNRVALFNVYSKLFKLRNVPKYLPTFTTGTVEYDLGGAFKWLKVSSDSLKILVVGNFDVIALTGAVTFQNAGVWYNYLTGGTRTATGSAESMTLQPGEYYVFVNQNVDSVQQVLLPLKLIGFDGKRTIENISITWSSLNEVDVEKFVIERSLNGSDFTVVSTVTAADRSTGQTDYYYTDKDPDVLTRPEKIYYRLKMYDKDGEFTYSKIITISPFAGNSQFKVYPNPVHGSIIYLQINEIFGLKMEIKIEDISGRLHNKYMVTGNNSNRNVPVDVSRLSSGVYRLKVKTSNSTYVRQFIVQH